MGFLTGYSDNVLIASKQRQGLVPSQNMSPVTGRGLGTKKSAIASRCA